LRNLINICSATISQSLEEQNDVQKLIEEAEKKIFDINQEKHSASITDIKSNLYEILERLSKSSTKAGEVSGIPSGYYKLDEITDGFHGSELIVLAARPGMGKTSLGLNIAAKAAVKYGHRIGIFSCEMSKESLVERILCSQASVDFSRMRKKMLKADEFDRLVHEAERLYDTTLVFDDTPNIPILELRSKARRMVKDYNVDLIIIDYLQIITVEESMNRNPRHEQIGYISRSLKGLARELNMPVIVLAQLNREIESRSDDSGPKLSDLKDSGSIEQDADLILFIHKKTVVEENQPYDTDIRQLIIGKNRFGPTGKIDMVFKKSYTRFEQLSKETEA
jgi:replicative DNA helicase